MEVICFEVSKELIDRVLNGVDCDFDFLDFVERFLVEDIRELVSIYGLKGEEFFKVIKKCWESMMCYKVWMSIEFDMRCCMFDVI